MVDQRTQGRHWRWPQGMLNRSILVASSVGLVAYAWELAGCLFFGRSHSFPQPSGRDVAVRVAILAFMLALFLVRFSRRTYRLLLPGCLVGGLADLLHSTALWPPLPWLACAPAAWGLLSCAEAALWVAALTHGERRDEFILTAPLALLGALSARQLGNPAAEWPPILDDKAGGHPGPAQMPR